MDQSNFNNAQKISMNNLKIEAHVSCFHCGEKIENVILFDDKKFCCNGCKTVYEIFSQNDLTCYYDFQTHTCRCGMNLEKLRVEKKCGNKK
jgi:hypothetical protein